MEVGDGPQCRCFELVVACAGGVQVRLDAPAASARVVVVEGHDVIELAACGGDLAAGVGAGAVRHPYAGSDLRGGAVGHCSGGWARVSTVTVAVAPVRCFRVAVDLGEQGSDRLGPGGFTDAPVPRGRGIVRCRSSRRPWRCWLWRDRSRRSDPSPVEQARYSNPASHCATGMFGVGRFGSWPRFRTLRRRRRILTARFGAARLGTARSTCA